jgi:serine protease Do
MLATPCAALEKGDLDRAARRILANDKTNDLAVVKTTLKPTKVAALKMSIRLGEGVAAFGYPLTAVLSSSGNRRRQGRSRSR